MASPVREQKHKSGSSKPSISVNKANSELAEKCGVVKGWEAMANARDDLDAEARERIVSSLQNAAEAIEREVVGDLRAVEREVVDRVGNPSENAEKVISGLVSGCTEEVKQLNRRLKALQSKSIDLEQSLKWAVTMLPEALLIVAISICVSWVWSSKIVAHGVSILDKETHAAQAKNQLAQAENERQSATKPIYKCEQLHLYLDNDDAGEAATRKLFESAQIPSKLADIRSYYEGYDVLNAWLIGQKALAVFISPSKNL